MTRFRLCKALPIAAFALALGAPGLAGALDYKVGSIVIEQPWTRAAPQGRTGAGYMVLRNSGSTPDRLVSASTPAARQVETHTMSMTDGIMRMRAVPTLELPPGGEIRLAPGVLHLMLVELTKALETGKSIPLTLVFEQAGAVTIELAVEKAGARAPGGHSGH